MTVCCCGEGLPAEACTFIICSWLNTTCTWWDYLNFLSFSRERSRELFLLPKQAALRDAEAERSRLCGALATMRADMEAVALSQAQIGQRPPGAVQLHPLPLPWAMDPPACREH